MEMEKYLVEKAAVTILLGCFCAVNSKHEYTPLLQSFR